MVKVSPITDFTERFDVGREVYVGTSPLRIESSQWHKGQVRILFAGVDSCEAAEKLKWSYLTAPADERPELEDGEYLSADLVGLKVVERGKELGVAEDVVRSTVNDLLKVSGVLIPAVRQFVKKVDIDGGTIEVELIDGMRPGDDAEEAR